MCTLQLPALPATLNRPNGLSAFALCIFKCSIESVGHSVCRSSLSGNLLGHKDRVCVCVCIVVTVTLLVCVCETSALINEYVVFALNQTVDFKPS